MKLLILIFSLCFSSLACAEIYEIIDEHGHKIYTDKPPLDKPDAKPVNVAPHTGNFWQNDSLQETNDEYYEELNQTEKTVKEVEEKEVAEIEELEEKAVDAVAEAEKALEEAKELKAGDYFPNKNDGMHYTPEYLERVEQAEDALNKAKEEADKYQ